MRSEPRSFSFIFDSREKRCSRGCPKKIGEAGAVSCLCPLSLFGHDPKIRGSLFLAPSRRNSFKVLPPLLPFFGSIAKSNFGFVCFSMLCTLNTSQEPNFNGCRLSIINDLPLKAMHDFCAWDATLMPRVVLPLGFSIQKRGFGEAYIMVRGA